MWVAMEHVLGKFERKIWVHTFDSPITPSLMPYAAGIEVKALEIAMYAPVNPFVAISHLVFSGIVSIVLVIETIS